MTYRRGDIALVYFPHSNLTTIKLRPVVVVQSDHLDTGIEQIVVAMISSNMQRAGHPSQVVVSLADQSASKTGLVLDSVIMTDNLATIEIGQFKSKLGALAKMNLIDKALAHTLALQIAEPLSP